MPKKGRRCSKLSEARNRFKEEAHEVENSNSNSERFNEVEIRIVKLKTESTEHNQKLKKPWTKFSEEEEITNRRSYKQDDGKQSKYQSWKKQVSRIQTHDDYITKFWRSFWHQWIS